VAGVQLRDFSFRKMPSRILKVFATFQHAFQFQSSGLILRSIDPLLGSCNSWTTTMETGVFSVWSMPCGGGVEYLHRSPASRRRRQKGNSRIWDSKIWSRVPRDSDLRMTALARSSSNCKRQIRPLVREITPHQQNLNCLAVIKIWS
jgi:hypothetical protein